MGLRVCRTVRMLQAACLLGLLVVCLLGLPEACTVLEDRTQCECTVTLHVERACEGEMYWMMVCQSPGREPRSGVLGDGTSDLELELGRGRWRLLCVQADAPAFLTAGGFSVKEGDSFPSLYGASLLVDATGEVAEDSVRLHKEYAAAYVSLRDLYSTDLSYEIAGDVCGMGVDGEPLDGPFRTRLEVSERGLSCVNLPRQGSSGGLRLEIYSEADDPSERTLLRSFALSEYILASGFDWSAPDLEDISLEVNYTRTVVTAFPDEWRKTLDFELSL